jgi:hypothetical protein
MLRREAGLVPFRPDVAYGDILSGHRRKRHGRTQELAAAFAVGSVYVEQDFPLDSRVV